MFQWNRFYKKSLFVRMMILTFLVSIIPVLILAWISTYNTRNALISNEYANLDDKKEYTKTQILQHVHEQVENLEVVSLAENTTTAIDGLLKLHAANTAGMFDGTDKFQNNYQAIYQQIYPFFLKVKDHWHITDLIFMDPEAGQALFSTKGIQSYYARPTEGMHKMWQLIKKNKKPAVIDYSLNPESNTVSSYVGVPVFDKYERIQMIIAVEMETDAMDHFLAINRKIVNKNAMIEFYLVGDDSKLRSQPLKATENKILQQEVDNEAVQNAKQGLSGRIETINYNGDQVLCDYIPLGLDENEYFVTNFDWYLLTEIDKSLIDSKVGKVNNRIILALIVIILIVMFFGFYIARNLTRPIMGMVDVARNISAGDLNLELKRSKRQDEIGQLEEAFIQMIENLKKHLIDLSESMMMLTNSVSGISATVSQLTSSSQETASAISETTATVEEVRQTAQLARDRATEVADGAKTTVKVANDGEQAVYDSIDGMSKIREQMESISEGITHLSEQSQLIGNIMNTINDLAEQSNLLAVNASIEAAKAGEEGKGFGVVANEVKNLSQQSKQATLQVREILTDIQKATSIAVMSTEQGRKAVEIGESQTEKAGISIKELAGTINQAMQASVQITTSTNEQFTGIDQVIEAMKGIELASAQNLDGVKQLESAAHGLESLGSSIQNMMEYYKLKN